MLSSIGLERLVETERPTFADADPVLNEPQRRRFEVFLELLEESLNEVERIASLPDPVDSVSRIGYDADTPIDFRDRTAPIIQRLRRQIEAVASALEIASRPRSRLNAIRAIVTAEIVRVEDTFSDKLGGYGTVSRRVKMEVDPELSRIRSDLKALLAELGPNKV